MSHFLQAILFATVLSATSAQTWEQLPPLPEPNAGFVAGAVSERIYVLGGTNWEGGKKNWLKSVHQFDPIISRWTSLPPLDRPLAYATAGMVGEALVVVGGFDGAAPSPLILHIGSHGTIAAGKGEMERPRALCSGGAIGGELLLVGGSVDPGNVQALSRSVRALNVTSGRERVLPDYPGAGIGTAASCIVGDELFLFAGANWDAADSGVKNSREAYAFSLGRNVWRPLRPYPIAVRGVSAVKIDDHRIYLAGGYAGDEFVDRAFLYDTLTDRYEEAPALPYRAQVGLVRCGNFVYCLGGEDQMKHRSSAVYRITASALLQALGGSTELPKKTDSP